MRDKIQILLIEELSVMAQGIKIFLEQSSNHKKVIIASTGDEDQELIDGSFNKSRSYKMAQIINQCQW